MTDPQTRGGQRTRGTLAVLGFHKIGSRKDGRDTWFYISEAAFCGHLRWLQESRWKVIDIQAFLAGMVSAESLPEYSVLLTFDDGYRSMRQVTLPLLRSFGFPAVLFVPTRFIGSTNAFDIGTEPEEEICSWNDLAELRDHSVSIQSHGVSHRRFSTLDDFELEAELKASKAALENRLGQPVEMLSYPYGDSGTRGSTSLALPRAGYRAAFLYGGGPNPVPVPNIYRIDRLAMGPDTDLALELEHE